MDKVKKENLPEFAQRVLALLPQQGDRACTLALMGELGAGKTTFVQALAKELEVKGAVQSPTYVLMKSYPINYGRFTKLVHIDLYRLNGEKEFETLHPKEFLDDPKALVCIEWPERAKNALPPPDMTLNFSSEDTSENERFIEIK